MSFRKEIGEESFGKKGVRKIWALDGELENVCLQKKWQSRVHGEESSVEKVKV